MLLETCIVNMQKFKWTEDLFVMALFTHEMYFRDHAISL